MSRRRFARGRRLPGNCGRVPIISWRFEHVAGHSSAPEPIPRAAAVDRHDRCVFPPRRRPAAGQPQTGSLLRTTPGSQIRWSIKQRPASSGSSALWLDHAMPPRFRWPPFEIGSSRRRSWRSPRDGLRAAGCTCGVRWNTREVHVPPGQVVSFVHLDRWRGPVRGLVVSGAPWRPAARSRSRSGVGARPGRARRRLKAQTFARKRALGELTTPTRMPRTHGYRGGIALQSARRSGCRCYPSLRLRAVRCPPAIFGVHVAEAGYDPLDRPAPTRIGATYGTARLIHPVLDQRSPRNSGPPSVMTAGTAQALPARNLQDHSRGGRPEVRVPPGNASMTQRPQPSLRRVSHDGSCAWSESAGVPRCGWNTRAAGFEVRQNRFDDADRPGTPRPPVRGAGAPAARATGKAGRRSRFSMRTLAAPTRTTSAANGHQREHPRAHPDPRAAPPYRSSVGPSVRELSIMFAAHPSRPQVVGVV